MTEEQIDLEFELILQDKKAKEGEEVFEDDGFEEWDKETDDHDDRLSDLPTLGSEESDPYAGHRTLPKPENTTTYDEDEWEEVE